MIAPRFAGAVHRARISFGANRALLEAWARSRTAGAQGVEPGPQTGEPVARSEPVAQSEPDPHGEPVAQSEPDPHGEPVAQSEPDPHGEPVAQGEPQPSDAAAIRALAELVVTALRATLTLSLHPAVRTSPIWTEVRAIRRRLSGHTLRLGAVTLGAIARRDTSGVAGELIRIFDAVQELLRRLALVGQRPVPDYLGGLATDAPYPSYRHSAANRGQVAPFTGPPGNGELRVTPIGGLIWATAIVDAAGDLYTGHAEGEFVALHPDGSVKWRIADPHMMYVDATGALGDDGHLYLASTDVDLRGHQNQGRLWKVDPSDGTVEWTFFARHFEDPESDPNAHLSGFFESSVALGKEGGNVTVYAGSDDNHLYKLDEHGNLLWEYDTGLEPAGVIWTKALLGPDGSTVFIGDMSGHVHAVRAADGSRRWVTGLGGSVVSSPALALHGQIVVGCFDGKVYCLDAADGDVLWSYQTLGLVYASCAIDGGDRGHGAGDIVVGSGDGGIYRLDRFGRRRWTYWTGAPIKASASLDADGNAYVGNQHGTLYCVAPDGRRAWSIATNPEVAGNDLNASPSLGANGTVYVGSTTGEQFAVPAAWCGTHPDDPRVSLDPGSDAARPPIEAGEGTLVHLDRSGTPQFGPAGTIGAHENLNLALFGVDRAGDVVDTRLSPAGLDISIEPDTPLDVRVDSKGRFLYVVPEAPLEPDTRYRMHVRAAYDAGGEARRLDQLLSLHTAPCAQGSEPPLAVGPDRVDAVVLHSARVATPKEIDALGQAMIDSQNFLIAPLHVDQAARLLMVAICWVHDAGHGTFEYRPTTVNKTVGAGRWHGDALHIETRLRLIAQGINIPFERVRFAARAVAAPAGPNLAEVSVRLEAPAAGVPDFAELIRVMGLADDRDDVVGFLTFSSQPFHGSAVARPPGVTGDLTVRTAQLAGSIAGLDDPDAHWLHLDVFDEATGAVTQLPADVVVRNADVEMVAALPEGVARDGAVAVLAVDLFPLAEARLGGR